MHITPPLVGFEFAYHRKFIETQQHAVFKCIGSILIERNWNGYQLHDIDTTDTNGL